MFESTPEYDQQHVTHGTSPLPSADALQIHALLGNCSQSHQELLRRPSSTVNTRNHLLLSPVEGQELY